ncbi:HNH endonuclease [compost metagenome]
MRPGDHVIVSGGGTRSGVFQITGEYEFCSDDDSVLSYCHQRSAQLTNLNADQLWIACNRRAARGHSTRWAVGLLQESSEASSLVFEEGHRYSLTSTAIERNPFARQKCLLHHGTACLVCGFSGEAVFGAAGRDLIHVHHLVEMASRNGPYKVDPAKDLVPLCPNCHSMAHRRNPAFTIPELRQMRGC